MPGVARKPSTPRIYRRSGAPAYWALMDAPRRTFAGDTGDVADLVGNAPSMVRRGAMRWDDGPRGRRLYSGAGGASTGCYATIPYQPRLDWSGGKPFGVSARIAFDGSSFGDGAILAQFSGSFSAGWMAWLFGNQVRLYVNGSIVCAATVPAAGEYHVAATLDGATARVYLDAILSATAAWTAAPATTGPTDFMVGGYGTNTSGSPDWTYGGPIDDIRFYGYAPTAKEVAKEYADPFWRLRPPRRRVAAPPPAAAGKTPWHLFTRAV